MIRFPGVDKGTPWSVRFSGTTNGDLVIPPARRIDAANPAGANYRFQAEGQLVLLGCVVTITATAVNQGILIVRREPPSTDTTLIACLSPAAGSYVFSMPELYIPLRSHVYSSPARDADRLSINMAGAAPFDSQVVAWGVWLDAKEHRETTTAPITISQ